MSLKERIYNVVETVKEKARKTAQAVVNWTADHQTETEAILLLTASAALLGAGVAAGKKSGRNEGFREGVEAVSAPEIHFHVTDQAGTEESEPESEAVETNIYKF